MLALVGSNHFQITITIEIGDINTDPGAAPCRHLGNDPWPLSLSHTRAGVLKVDEMLELGGDHHVEPAIAVDVPDCRILSRSHFGAFTEGRKLPAIRVRRAEGEPYVIRVFVHRDDVEIAITVEIGHLQAVGAANRYSAKLFVVDPMLAPGDPGAIRRSRLGEGLGDGRDRGVLLRCATSGRHRCSRYRHTEDASAVPGESSSTFHRSSLPPFQPSAMSETQH